MTKTSLSQLVSVDDYFTLGPGSAIAGHWILRPQHPVKQLSELSAEALAAFGPLLARGMAAIQKMVGPERVYILRFGEEIEAIHFHFFPRTRQMGEMYRADHPEQSSISGAQMFEWARRPDVMRQLQGLLTPEQTLDQIRLSFGK